MTATGQSKREQPETRYERMTAAAIEAADTLSLDAGQQDRYELAKQIAAETGSAVVSALPIINGRHHALCGLPPVVRLERDCGYSLGYESLAAPEREASR